ncbi:MAG: hypothetical protein HYY76_00025 [Acidobacteria bacterium]|nr:hypothetical protein [Acidobacteriota bacterium]
MEAETPGANVRRFVQRAKQHSGAAYARRCRQPLWQSGYRQQQLRQDTDVREVARYILWNPVGEGLTQTPAEYPYLGSYVWSVEDLIE